MKFEPIIVDGELIDLTLHGMAGFKSEEEKKFYIDSMLYLTKALSSAKFKALFHSLDVSETNGEKLSEVYKKIMGGWCSYFKKFDGDVDIFITIYENGRNTKTIGYSFGKLKIWTSRYFFSRWLKKKDYASLAAHTFHEYLHGMGYKHKWRHRGTLVYEAGYLVRDIVKDIVGGSTEDKAYFF